MSTRALSPREHEGSGLEIHCGLVQKELAKQPGGTWSSASPHTIRNVIAGTTEPPNWSQLGGDSAAVIEGCSWLAPPLDCLLTGFLPPVPK